MNLPTQIKAGLQLLIWPNNKGQFLCIDKYQWGCMPPIFLPMHYIKVSELEELIPKQPIGHPEDHQPDTKEDDTNG